MRTRTWIVLLLALASGLIAGYAALELMSGQPSQQAPEEPRSTFQVVVAARDLPVGSLLGEEDVRAIEWPGEIVPEGFAQQIPDVIGRGIILPIKTNEPILLTKLMDRGAGGGLPILIPEGMRAITVRVDDVISVAGFVTPYTRVDLMLTMQPMGSTEWVTQIIEQNLEVAAVNQINTQDPQGNPLPSYTNVSLFVTPEQAQKITLATQQGRIQFALRNQLDVREIRPVPARASRLLALGGGAPAASRTRTTPTATPQTSNTLEVLRGSQRSLIRFGSGGGNQ
jgi:pilus assembly protein CpaB